MPIAVLGWGSLIWQPANRHGALTVAPGARWDPGGPRLPIEFARISDDGRLTAIALPGYPSEVPVLWIISGHAELGDALVDLARRETNSPIGRIHGVTAAGAPVGRPDNGVAGRVHAWLRGRPTIDAAVWTGLGQGRRWDNGFSVDAAVSYLESLEGGTRQRALEYLRRAPRQIDTPVRRASAHLLDDSR